MTFPEHLKSRIFLNWDEAATCLGFDREGLRQALLLTWNGLDGKPWLPVVIDSGSLSYFATLGVSDSIGHSIQEDPLGETDGKAIDLQFEHGAKFPKAGKTSSAAWEAVDARDSGYSVVYLVDGRLILDPRSVVCACRQDANLEGYIPSAAPREWIEDSFEKINFSFLLLSRDRDDIASLPTSLYEDALFYAGDVFNFAKETYVKSAVIENSSVWPWGDHETELLRHLAAAAKQFWSTYDRDNQSTAPKNSEVEAWLVQQGVSKRTAEAMATLLRPEHIRTGPR